MKMNIEAIFFTWSSFLLSASNAIPTTRTPLGSSTKALPFALTTLIIILSHSGKTLLHFAFPQNIARAKHRLMYAIPAFRLWSLRNDYNEFIDHLCHRASSRPFSETVKSSLRKRKEKKEKH